MMDKAKLYGWAGLLQARVTYALSLSKGNLPSNFWWLRTNNNCVEIHVWIIYIVTHQNFNRENDCLKYDVRSKIMFLGTNWFPNHTIVCLLSLMPFRLISEFKLCSSFFVSSVFHCFFFPLFLIFLSLEIHINVQCLIWCILEEFNVVISLDFLFPPGQNSSTKINPSLLLCFWSAQLNWVCIKYKLWSMPILFHVCTQAFLQATGQKLGKL